MTAFIIKLLSIHYLTNAFVKDSIDLRIINVNVSINMKPKIWIAVITHAMGAIKINVSNAKILIPLLTQSLGNAHYANHYIITMVIYVN